MCSFVQDGTELPECCWSSSRQLESIPSYSWLLSSSFWKDFGILEVNHSPQNYNHWPALVAIVFMCFIQFKFLVNGVKPRMVQKLLMCCHWGLGEAIRQFLVDNRQVKTLPVFLSGSLCDSFFNASGTCCFMIWWMTKWTEQNVQLIVNMLSSFIYLFN